MCFYRKSFDGKADEHAAAEGVGRNTVSAVVGGGPRYCRCLLKNSTTFARIGKSLEEATVQIDLRFPVDDYLFPPIRVDTEISPALRMQTPPQHLRASLCADRVVAMLSNHTLCAASPHTITQAG